MTSSLISDVEQHFTKRTPEYTAIRDLSLNLHDDNDSNGKFLEIGCGARFSLDTKKVKYGVDLTKSLLLNLKRFDQKANLVVADVRYLPFVSNEFESVGAVFVLHHLIGNTPKGTLCNIEQCLSEMNRVNKKAGSILVFEHLPDTKIMTLVCYYVTIFMSKLRININYFDIEDGVITYFLDQKTFYRLFTKQGMELKVFFSRLWKIRGIKIGNTTQFIAHNKKDYGM